MERGAAPAGRGSSPWHPGCMGAPPGGTTASCREPADAMRRSRRMEAKRGPMPKENAARKRPHGTSLCGCDAPKGGRLSAMAGGVSGMPCVFRRIIPLTFLPRLRRARAGQTTGPAKPLSFPSPHERSEMVGRVASAKREPGGGRSTSSGQIRKTIKAPPRSPSLRSVDRPSPPLRGGGKRKIAEDETSVASAAFLTILRRNKRARELHKNPSSGPRFVSGPNI